MNWKIIAIAALVSLVFSLLRRTSAKGTAGKTSGSTATANPNDLLFSVPTLCDLAPPLEPMSDSDAPYWMHEDDWRQVEFTLATEHTAAETMRAQIRQSVEANRIGLGYRHIFLRPELPHGLANAEIPLDAVKAAFSIAETAPLSMGPKGGTTSFVARGFAAKVDGLGTLYGRTDEKSQVLALGVHDRKSVLSEDARERVKAFATQFDLELVDWQAQDWVHAKTPHEG